MSSDVSKQYNSQVDDRNVERLLVREFLLSKTEKAGFGGLDFSVHPKEQKVTLSAESCWNGDWSKGQDHQRTATPSAE